MKIPNVPRLRISKVLCPSCLSMNKFVCLKENSASEGRYWFKTSLAADKLTGLDKGIQHP